MKALLDCTSDDHAFANPISSLIRRLWDVESAHKLFIEAREDVKNNAGQIMHNHVGEFICNRSAFKHGETLGTTKDWTEVVVAQ